MLNTINENHRDSVPKEISMMLDKHYPERWDYIDGRCVIHFPFFIISNSNGNTHEIKNLFVFFYLCCDTKRIGEIRGFRTTQSFLEYKSTYFHSHLRSKQLENINFNGVSNFCLGKSNFSKVCAELRWQYNPTEFEFFLIQLESFLKWESLEGVPYKKIKELTYGNGHMNFNEPELKHVYQDDNLSSVIEKIKEYFKVVVENGKFSVKLRDKKDLLEDITNAIYYGNTPVLDNKNYLATYSNGRYFSSEVGEFLDPNIEGFFQFRGKNYPLVVENSLSNENFTIVLNPSFVNMIESILTKTLRKNYAENYFQKNSQVNNS